jgi:predicted ATPase
LHGFFKEDHTLEADYSPDAAAKARDWLVVISGCSGGGKSTLLAELAARGFRTFAEPGRQIVKEQTAIGGDALPYVNDRAFGELCISRTMNLMIEAADADDYVFFDRGLIDPIAYCDHAGLDVPAHWTRAAELFRFNAKVFLVPPWPEIFANDAERKHSFADALAQYRTLPLTYERFGYAPVIVPKAAVADRADFILRSLPARSTRR